MLPDAFDALGENAVYNLWWSDALRWEIEDTSIAGDVRQVIKRKKEEITDDF